MKLFRPDALFAGSVAATVALAPRLAWAQDDTLNSGDTAWMLMSSVLVLFMTIPGLALFYAGLVRFMTSSPVLVMALEGVGAISVCRSMMGATFGSQADSGTIRGDFGVSNSFNLIHGSDSPEAAERELSLFFNDGEILGWDRAVEGWVYDLSGEEPE